MKKTNNIKIVILLTSLISVTSGAVEVCEIETVSKPFKSSNTNYQSVDTVRITCSSIGELRKLFSKGMKIYTNSENGQLYYTIETLDRTKIKKELIKAGYKLSSSCSQFETFIQN